MQFTMYEKIWSLPTCYTSKGLRSLLICYVSKMLEAFVTIFEALQGRKNEYFVDNKTKGRTTKPVFQENKVRQISRKTNISYPLMRTRKI